MFERRRTALRPTRRRDAASVVQVKNDAGATSPLGLRKEANIERVWNKHG
jgi:hypothetical protein